MTGPSIPLVEGARLDHVAVAVRDPAAGAALFRDVMGGAFLMGADQPDQAFRFVHTAFPAGARSSWSLRSVRAS